VVALVVVGVAVVGGIAYVAGRGRRKGDSVSTGPEVD
jgi:hypothetical protein